MTQITTFEEFCSVAIRRIIEQGCRSSFQGFGGSTCLYFDPNTGNRCVIGQMIPPEIGETLNYGKECRESQAVNADPVLEELEKLYPGIPFRENVKVLIDLQSCHDDAGDNGEFVGDFKRHLAKREIPIPEGV